MSFPETRLTLFFYLDPKNVMDFILGPKFLEFNFQLLLIMQHVRIIFSLKQNMSK